MSIKFFKTLTLPDILEANSIYFVSSDNIQNGMNIYVTGNTPDIVKTIISSGTTVGEGSYDFNVQEWNLENTTISEKTVYVNDGALYENNILSFKPIDSHIYGIKQNEHISNAPGITYNETIIQYNATSIAPYDPSRNYYYSALDVDDVRVKYTSGQNFVLAATTNEGNDVLAIQSGSDPYIFITCESSKTSVTTSATITLTNSYKVESNELSNPNDVIGFFDANENSIVFAQGDQYKTYSLSAPTTKKWRFIIYYLSQVDYNIPVSRYYSDYYAYINVNELPITSYDIIVDSNNFAGVAHLVLNGLTNSPELIRSSLKPVVDMMFYSGNIYIYIYDGTGTQINQTSTTFSSLADENGKIKFTVDPKANTFKYGSVVINLSTEILSVIPMSRALFAVRDPANRFGVEITNLNITTYNNATIPLNAEDGSIYKVTKYGKYNNKFYDEGSLITFYNDLQNYYVIQEDGFTYNQKLLLKDIISSESADKLGKNEVATMAKKLETARKINDTPFDGSADISIKSRGFVVTSATYPYDTNASILNITYTESVGIGHLANNAGYSSVAIGASSSSQSESTSIGKNAKSGYYGTSIGYNANTTDWYNVIIGYNAYASNNSSNSIVHGANSYLNSSSSSIVLGYNSSINNASSSIVLGSSNALSNYSNSILIGNNVSVTASYQIQLGNGVQTVYTYNAIQNRSDERDKTLIQDIDIGLNFINQLSPKKYKWDRREDYMEIKFPLPERVNKPIELSEEESSIQENIDNYNISLEQYNKYIEDLNEVMHNRSEFLKNPVKDGSKVGKRWHFGLIAQDMKTLVNDYYQDYSLYQDHSLNGGEDVLSIGYSELIAPMIKAIQELSQLNQELINKCNDLEIRLHNLENNK